MMNPDRGEHLGRALRLVSFHPHFVTSDFLVIFLAENRDHIESRASSKSRCDQLNGFRSGSPGTIVQQEIVLTAGSSNELSLLSKRLCQFNFCRNHGSPLTGSSMGAT